MSDTNTPKTDRIPLRHRLADGLFWHHGCRNVDFSSGEKGIGGWYVDTSEVEDLGEARGLTGILAYAASRGIMVSA